MNSVHRYVGCLASVLASSDSELKRSNTCELQVNEFRAPLCWLSCIGAGAFGQRIEAIEDLRCASDWWIRFRGEEVYNASVAWFLVETDSRGKGTYLKRVELELLRL